MKQLRKIYRLEKPEQIKLRIIFMLMKHLMLLTAGRTPQNVKIIKHYDAHFRRCEEFEAVHSPQ